MRKSIRNRSEVIWFMNTDSSSSREGGWAPSWLRSKRPTVSILSLQSRETAKEHRWIVARRIVFLCEGVWALFLIGCGAGDIQRKMQIKVAAVLGGFGRLLRAVESAFDALAIVARECEFV